MKYLICINFHEVEFDIKNLFYWQFFVLQGHICYWLQFYKYILLQNLKPRTLLQIFNSRALSKNIRKHMLHQRNFLWEKQYTCKMLEKCQSITRNILRVRFAGRKKSKKILTWHFKNGNQRNTFRWKIPSRIINLFYCTWALCVFFTVFHLWKVFFWFISNDSDLTTSIVQLCINVTDNNTKIKNATLSYKSRFSK